MSTYLVTSYLPILCVNAKAPGRQALARTWGVRKKSDLKPYQVAQIWQPPRHRSSQQRSPETSSKSRGIRASRSSSRSVYSLVGSSMLSPPPPPSPTWLTPRVAHARQFVQALGNPSYLNHLAAQKFLANPEFVAYLAYLQYWSRPPYIKYLAFPAPTLKALQLLQQERFRRDIISPDLVSALATEWARASVEWHREG